MGQTADEVRQEIERSRDDLGQTLDAIGDRVSPAKIIERRKESVRGSMTSLKNKVMGTAQSGKEATANTVGSLQDGIHSGVEMGMQAPHKVAEETQGNPLAAGLIAFGVGALAATLIPESRTEADQINKAVEPVRQELTTAGREVAEELKTSAQEGAEAVKDKVATSAEEVKSEAQRAVIDVSSEAKESVESLKQ